MKAFDPIPDAQTLFGRGMPRMNRHTIDHVIQQAKNLGLHVSAWSPDGRTVYQIETPNGARIGNAIGAGNALEILWAIGNWEQYKKGRIT